MLHNPNWERPLNPVGEALLKAADLLVLRGHTKFTRKDENGSMCLLGALEAAQGNVRHTWPDSPLTEKAAEAVVEVMGLSNRLAKCHNSPRRVAAEWNNEEERTAQEVIDALRLAARVAQPVD